MSGLNRREVLKLTIAGLTVGSDMLVVEPAMGKMDVVVNSLLFAKKPNGELSFYSYKTLPKPGNFENGGSETVISDGWNQYSQLFSGGPGVLFAKKPNGELSFYSYKGERGLPKPGNFENRGSETVISDGWNQYILIFHGYPEGLIAILED